MTKPCLLCKKEYKPIRKRQKYCSHRCGTKAQHERREIGFEIYNPNYNGGVHIDKGYRRIRISGHPLADKQGYVSEHRLKMQDKLFEGCIVHHKNHNRADNRIENLEVLTRAEHNKGHIKEMKYDATA